jgi:hypothetical protein
LILVFLGLPGPEGQQRVGAQIHFPAQRLGHRNALTPISLPFMLWPLPNQSSRASTSAMQAKQDLIQQGSTRLEHTMAMRWSGMNHIKFFPSITPLSSCPWNMMYVPWAIILFPVDVRGSPPAIIGTHIGPVGP